MIKICHVSTVHRRVDTRIFFKQCRLLANNRYRVSLLIADGQGHEERDSVKIYDLGAHHTKIMRMVRGTIDVYKHIVKEQYELIHIHDPELLPVACILKLRGFRVVYDMHENFPAQVYQRKSVPRLFAGPIAGILAFLQRIVLKKMFVVFAEDSYERAFSKLENVVVVRNYPDLEVLDAIRKSSDKQLVKSKSANLIKLGYVGSVTKHRGALTMFKVAKELKRIGFEVKLTIVGPLHVSTTHERNGLTSDEVELTGPLDAENAWERVKNCDFGLGLVPILSNFETYVEWFGREAPVLFVNPNDVKEIVRSIEQCLPLSGPYHKKLDKMEKLKHSYSWASEGQKLLYFYDSVK